MLGGSDRCVKTPGTGKHKMPAGRPKALDPQTAMPIILRLFWHDGYGGVTLDQLAAQLGVTKPTLCRALGEKEAVYAAALGAYHEAFIAPAEAHLNGATTLRDALAGAFAVFVDRVLDERLPAGCFLGDSSMVGGFGTGLIAETIDALRGSLAAAVQQRVRGALEDGELEPASSVQPVVAYILGQISALGDIAFSR